MNVFESPDILKYLTKRDLITQHQKAKKLLIDGHKQSIRFKKREPKETNTWYFRINQQYRAIGYFDHDNDFIIVEINNHQ